MYLQSKTDNLVVSYYTHESSCLGYQHTLYKPITALTLFYLEQKLDDNSYSLLHISSLLTI